MAIQVHKGGIIEGMIGSVIVALAVWGHNKGQLWMKLISKRSRDKALKDMRSADYIQKRQRDVFKYIGASIYFLGAYLIFSFDHNPGTMKSRIIFALIILFCGGMAMGNASVMNEYGVQKQRESLEKEELKEQQRTARRKELDNLR